MHSTAVSMLIWTKRRRIRNQTTPTLPGKWIRYDFYRQPFTLADFTLQDANLLTEDISIRPAGSMPPLLQRLNERQPEKLDYLGVSYGLTPQLLRFWKRSGYIPLYVRQTSNELTGEHTCVMVRGLSSTPKPEMEWMPEFAKG
jgi:hypothetical protein